jgi:hypothetical protein
MEDRTHVWCVYTVSSDCSNNHRELTGIYTTSVSAVSAKLSLKMSIAGAKSGYKRDYNTTFDEDLELINSMNSTLCDQPIYQDTKERLDRAMEKKPILKVEKIKIEKIELDKKLN